MNNMCVDRDDVLFAYYQELNDTNSSNYEIFEPMEVEYKAPQAPPKREAHFSDGRKVKILSRKRNGKYSTSNLVKSCEVTECARCGILESIQWRNGPSGKADLCNACGLRYLQIKKAESNQDYPQTRLGMMDISFLVDDDE